MTAWGSRSVDLAKDLVYNGLMEVNVHEAKTHLSKLLERVLLGEEVVIAKAGTPIAKLVPISAKPKTRIFGSAKGEFTVPDDFNEPDAEIEKLFYEGELFPKDYSKK
jgi:prevent-host-death family protein